MKNINEYVKQASNVHPTQLDEYLSTKVKNADMLDCKYYIVCPYGDNFKEIANEYEDVCLTPSWGPSMFIMQAKDVKKYFGTKDTYIYKVPEEYFDDINKLEEDIMSGKLDTEELENINAKNCRR